MVRENNHLEIGFFFATEKTKHDQKKEMYQIFCKTMNLKDLKDYFDDKNDGLMYHINVVAKDYYSTLDDSRCFDVPKSWFVNHKNEKEEPW